MQKLLHAAVLGALATTPLGAGAQVMGHDHSKMGLSQQAPMSTAPEAQAA